MIARHKNYRRYTVVAMAVATFACTTLTGCFVAGVSSGGGFFIWPGSIGLLVILLIFFLLRRR